MLNAQQAPDDRYQRFADLAPFVREAIDTIAALTPAQRVDVDFLEREFIPALGLNDELLHEQPPELAPSFGKGLHLWQYPNQLAPYLAWLARNAAGITSYMEIGCRWGGMFILVAEWLRTSGADLQEGDCTRSDRADAVHRDLFRTAAGAGAHRADLHAGVFNLAAGRRACRPAEARLRFHRRRSQPARCDAGSPAGARHARIIVHHDIHSQACPDTTWLWKALREFEAPSFDAFEFTSQYASVNGSFLGIGAMKRRSAQA
ncbi:hypothetical protein [Bradyrhizobium sp. NAS96.2]|uniref:hypothetical protein n=1 Tax=Bradyrhizobium sp. NAS96.2 TaxID=1680160 RepID=UPI000938ED04|nr:hypothetical protein [Bradyrhizobium sp. NAS96.2]OKO82321.1 hypothetical protein AC628_04505 [Bradyrhizobium sp. NAS96.2]